MGSHLVMNQYLYVAGEYTVTCWADVMTSGGQMDSGLPSETSTRPGGVVWTPVYQKGEGAAFDVGEKHLLTLVGASAHRIVKLVCTGCKQGEAESAMYFRVGETATGVHQALTGGTMGSGNVDMKMYSSLAGAMEGRDDEELESLTTWRSLRLYVETTPGCTPRGGRPAVGTESEELGTTQTFDECVELVKRLRHGMVGSELAVGATWIPLKATVSGKAPGTCMAELLVGDATPPSRWEVARDEDASEWKTCGFPVVQTYVPGAGCTCDGFPCPCTAPPRSNPMLRKTCGVTVVPSKEDHLTCISRSADVFAGQPYEVTAAVRDEYGNRVVSLSSGEAWIVAEGGRAAEGKGLVPARPTGQWTSGVAKMSLKYLTAETVDLLVETNVPALYGRRFDCQMRVWTECPPYLRGCPTPEPAPPCCQGKTPCPGAGQLLTCPADAATLKFLQQPPDDRDCKEEGHVVAGELFPTITVAVYDKYLNLKKLTPITVTLSLATVGPVGEPPKEELRGTLTQITNGGIAVFKDIRYDRAERIKLKATAVEEGAVIAQKTQTIEVRSSQTVRVCPNDICEVEAKEVPDTCTLGVANDNPVRVKVKDAKGNELLGHQTEDCRVRIDVAQTGTAGTPKWRMVDPRTSSTVGTGDAKFGTERAERAVYGHTVVREGTDTFLMYGGSTVLPGKSELNGEELETLPTQYTHLNGKLPKLRNVVWRFNLTSEKWTKLWDGDEVTSVTARARAGSLAHEWRGGECWTVNRTGPVEDIRECDAAGPAARMGHVSVVGQSTSGASYMFVFGGHSDAWCCNGDVWRFGPLGDASPTWRQVDLSQSPLRPTMAYSSGVLYNNKLYVFSGYGG
eukprot:Sspe_Gene.895::Locus_304_Transcript_1_1_Confidence_1.000_Length_2556::g.895::m.895